MTNYNEKLNKILNSDYGVLHCCGDYQEEAKQAITSLIKELVAEAKPKDMDSFYEKPIVDEFEQNLLKALEEV